MMMVNKTSRRSKHKGVKTNNMLLTNSSVIIKFNKIRSSLVRIIIG